MLVEQRRAFADRLELFSHPRGSVGGFVQVHPIAVVEPVDIERCEFFERGTLRAQEPAVADGPPPRDRDPPPQRQ